VDSNEEPRFVHFVLLDDDKPLGYMNFTSQLTTASGFFDTAMPVVDRGVVVDGAFLDNMMVKVLKVVEDNYLPDNELYDFQISTQPEGSNLTFITNVTFPESLSRFDVLWSLGYSGSSESVLGQVDAYSILGPENSSVAIVTLRGAKEMSPIARIALIVATAVLIVLCVFVVRLGLSPAELRILLDEKEASDAMGPEETWVNPLLRKPATVKAVSPGDAHFG